MPLLEVNFEQAFRDDLVQRLTSTLCNLRYSKQPRAEVCNVRLGLPVSGSRAFGKEIQPPVISSVMCGTP